jgi:single-stranded DNA-binding protein
MNKFTGVGRLPRAAVLNGEEKKVLKFTLATVYGHNSKTNKDLLAYVPCVLFQPPEELKQVLMESWKDVTIEVEGHVATSKFETKEGETKYSTEVVVDRGGVRPVAVPEPLPFD